MSKEIINLFIYKKMANSERVTNLKKIQISDPFYFLKNS